MLKFAQEDMKIITLDCEVSTMSKIDERRQMYLLDDTLPKELKQAIKDFLDAKENMPQRADLYSDELRSWAHNFAGYKIS